jgi:hypothetical protein
LGSSTLIQHLSIPVLLCVSMWPAAHGAPLPAGDLHDTLADDIGQLDMAISMIEAALEEHAKLMR